MAAVSEQTKMQHLYLRAGFGETLAFINDNKRRNIKKSVAELFDNAKQFSDFNIVKDNAIAMSRIMGADKEEIKEMVKESVEQIKELNLAWLDRMSDSKQALRERMTFFWHGHFACQSKNIFFVQQQNNTLRQHALGKFGDLLMGISKSAAMLDFLNNKQNKKNSPNENFAREVMELFTLGRGNYTEQDIKNAARAFTGWNFDQTGAFMFRRFQHDYGTKTFMNKTGNFSGEDILKMLLENKQTALFITKKIYAYFVNEKIDEEIVQTLAQKFYESDYDIGALMQEIFTADWFYEPQNIGSKVKSPIDLILILRKQFGLKLNEPAPWIYLQKVLGQVLFYPPNVAGWKGGTYWIDSSTLALRTQLPTVLFFSDEFPIQAKDDGDVNTEFLNKRSFKSISADFDWASYQKLLGKDNEAEMLEQLSEYLLQNSLSEANKQLVLNNARRTNKEDTLKMIAIGIASLPEYQLY